MKVEYAGEGYLRLTDDRGFTVPCRITGFSIADADGANPRVEFEVDVPNLNVELVEDADGKRVVAIWVGK